MTEFEFRRWYWLREELVAFARVLGVSPAGSKRELADRIADALAGRPIRRVTTARTGVQLEGPLTESTVIPVGQRSTQLLREWFEERIGPRFRFDATMREYLAGGGATLGDAVAHWHASRGGGPKPLEPQFELNRFTRAWHAEHPGGTRDELLAAWRVYRALPVEARGLA